MFVFCETYVVGGFKKKKKGRAKALILHGLSNCALSDPIDLRWKPNLLGQGQHQAEDGLAAHMQTAGLKKDYLGKSAQLEEQMACVVCQRDGVVV